tara:strand:+ start:1737 stop:2168 length:432 start_codon:yes stop_codon:yes gene_type:complete
MNTAEFLSSLAVELGDYLEVCGRAYHLVQEENRCLNSSSPRDAYAKSEERKELLERVSGAMVRIKAHKALWAKIPAAERAKHMNISQLIKLNMDLIMKTVMLDRENEKLMLQHGMVPPDRLPSSAQNNPGAVAGIYQRNQPGG